MLKSNVASADDMNGSLPAKNLHPIRAAGESDSARKCNTVPIRISHHTKAELERIGTQIEQGGGRRRVKAGAIIEHAIARLREQDLEELRSKTVSYSEMFEREFQRHKAEHASVTRDEFLGMVLLGKVKVRTGALLAK